VIALEEDEVSDAAQNENDGAQNEYHKHDVGSVVKSRCACQHAFDAPACDMQNRNFCNDTDTFNTVFGSRRS
jgi:hypothetical protein